MKKLLYFILILFTSALLCCKKETRIDYIDSKAPAPAQVSQVQTVSMPGGVVITYKIPLDTNLSYVKAVYEIQPGVFREASASNYTDTLKLVGFGDTLSHKVKLYSVGKNEKKSDPLSIEVHPLIPPVLSVFKTVDIIATFGGVQVGFKNSSQADLAIVVIMDTTGQNTWSPITTFHTGALEGNFSVRGLDSTRKKFGVFIRDRWNNKSDTLFKSLSPIFEQEIPKSTWKPLVLPTDQTALASTHYVLSNLWNGKISWTGGDYPYATANASTLPQWFTIDLGVKVMISRIVEHQAPHSHLYQASAVKTFELWGSNNPNPDGTWASWDSLGTFHSFKPSGLPLGQNSAEDVNYGWLQGEDFVFDHALPAYRYIRWKTLQTYSNSGQVVIQEIDLYGQIVH